jgi:RNA polymerase sigma-70 factor (ECF subfamily)
MRAGWRPPPDGPVLLVQLHDRAVVPDVDSTAWEMIEGAARGDLAGREAFAARYGRSIRALLQARWRQSTLAANIEDAVQDVFLECFKHGGALTHVDRAGFGRFRPFLHGVIRNVALRHEGRVDLLRRRQTDDSLLDAQPAADPSLSRLIDRELALAIVREAADELARRASRKGEGARRRVELLRLRFQEDLPIRDIAARWNVPASLVHHDFAKARVEFRHVLLMVAARHLPGSPDQVARECARMLDLLE